MIQEKLCKLIDLKSIISIIVVVSYTAMVFKGIVEPDYKEILLVVITYYFAKKENEKNV